MMEDTSPLGKSVEEIERESGNRDPDRDADGAEGVQGGVVIPPMGLSGASSTAITGTGMGVPVMPVADRGGQADEDGES